MTKPTSVSRPLVWLTLWISVVLEFGCLTSIPLLAVHHPSRYPGQPTLPPDWKTPLLLVMLFASVLTWQTWSEQKSGKKRNKPAKPVDAATRRKNSRIIGLILAFPLLLLECMWVFVTPGIHVDWLLLAACHVGILAGVLCLLWSMRQLSDMKAAAEMASPGWTAVSVPVTPIPLEKAADTTWYAGSQPVLSEAAIGWVTFLCCFVIVVLAFTPGCATFMSAKPLYWPLILFFGSMGAVIALATALMCKKSRGDDQTRFALTQDPSVLQETPKGVNGYYVSFLVIGVMFAIVSFSHTDWVLFALCNVGEFAAFLLLRWVLSRPPSAGLTVTLPQIDWLPKAGVVRATPNEIVLAAPWGLRVFVGGFGLVMAGMTVMCLLLIFAPGLFESHPARPYKHPHEAHLFLTVVPAFLFVGMAFFTTLIIGGAGPRDLRLELDSRRYTQRNWKPMTKERSGEGFNLPFVVVHTSGSMGEDMAGPCLREYTYKGNTSHILQIQWRDPAKPAYVLKRFSVPEEAQIALTKAAAALQLPIVEECV